MTGLAPGFDLLRSDWPVFAATDEQVNSKLNVTAAWDGLPIAQVDVAGERHVQDALFAAFSMFRQKDRWLSCTRRTELLEKFCELTKQHSETLATESARESGKPLIETRADVQRVLDCARLAIERLHSEADQDFAGVAQLPAVQEEHLFQRYEPGGVVVAILASNNGLELAARYLLAAVAASCPIIVKPSSDAPLSCLRLVHMLHEVGLPYVWSQCVITQSEQVTRELICDPRVAQLSFVGSSELGWSLRGQLPPGTRCTLDHGGVTPAIVADDADFERARDALLTGAFLCSGQHSLSIQRVFVSTDRAESLAREIARRADALPWGDPLRSSTRIGPLIREAEVQRVDTWVAEAVAAGAQLMGGGFAHNERCYAPTVLLDPPIDALVSTQPVFGPVLCVYSCTNLLHACDRANALPYAQVATVFTRSDKTLETFFAALDASVVTLNGDPSVISQRTPQQGLRRSGLGERDMLATIDAMQVRKTLVSG